MTIWRDFRRAREMPSFELGETTTPSPHHPIGAKGVGESATVGSPDMPMTPDKVWEALNEVGLAE